MREVAVVVPCSSARSTVSPGSTVGPIIVVHAEHKSCHSIMMPRFRAAGSRRAGVRRGRGFLSAFVAAGQDCLASASRSRRKELRSPAGGTLEARCRPRKTRSTITAPCGGRRMPGMPDEGARSASPVANRPSSREARWGPGDQYELSAGARDSNASCRKTPTRRRRPSCSTSRSAAGSHA